MNLKNKRILVTGAAGFIGSGIVRKLLAESIEVIGIDNMNNYYNPLLKEKRIETIKEIDQSNLWRFHKLNILDSKK